MLRKFIGEKYMCGLDIGAQSIKASLVNTEDPSHSKLLGVYETPTEGFKESSITDLGELSECVHRAISGLSKRTGIKIKDVQLGVGSELIEPRYSKAVIPLMDRGNKVVTSRDIQKIQQQARLLGLKMEETVLHDFPQLYKIDDVNTAYNPIGLYGRKLEIDSLLLVINSNLMKNLTRAVNQAGYDVANLFFSSMASAFASLNDYQRRQGCILIDMGCSMMNILIFKEGHLKHLSSLDLGGADFTRGIAKKLNIPYDLAEEIKKSYAMASVMENEADEEILIKKDEGYIPIKKSFIYEAMEPILEKFITTVVKTIKGTGLLEEMNIGIILVGAGSLLPGFAERIEQSVGLPVKIGKISIAMRRLQYAAKYASAVGLAQIGASKNFGFSPHVEGHPHLAARFVHKVKELYQEYF